MKIQPLFGVRVLFFLGIIVGMLWGDIVNSKHNFSSGASAVVRTVKSPDEPEVCVFCHIPHSANAGEPLWNRSMTAASNYSGKMYDSDYLRRMNYPTPTTLGSTAGSPGTVSRQCLSCHDGTVAIGSVYVVRGTYMGNRITMDAGSVNADGTILTTSNGYIGTDLKGHHPVGIEYNHNINKAFGSGSRGIELKIIDKNTSAIKLYTYNGVDYVECSSCHDPHISTPKFLRVSGATHGQRVYATCTSCHDKTNWTAGAHANSNLPYGDLTVRDFYGSDTVDSLGCVNCHKPHNGAGKPYLLRKVEENTCFEGAGSGTTSTVPCHGVSGTSGKDIQSILTNANNKYKHPVTTITGQHSNLDVFFGVDVTSDMGTGVTWAANKHAECTDCHNPHQAKAGVHSASGSDYPAAPDSFSNQITNSGPLTGVTGVEPTWPNGWIQPAMSDFKTLESATKEYQICFKCHSYWGLGAATGGVSSFKLSQHPINATDQAWEFNPYNRAAHPVVMTTNDMLALPGGRYATPLSAAAMKAPWDAKVGNQTMMCSDCHGGENESTVAAVKGPHGSSIPFMLKGQRKNWPLKNATTLYTMADGQLNNYAGEANIFCLNCHEYGAVAVHQTARAKMVSAACVECHIAVPHGGPVSRMIGYSSMPEPYNYNFGGVLQLKTNGYRWNSTNSANDLYSTATGCASGGNGNGGGCHGTASGTYDTIP